MKIPTSKLTGRLLVIQSIVYIVTGVWPLFHIDSFMMITGPKVDLWLVRTVGLLLASAGMFFLIAWKNKEFTISMSVLAILMAASLATVDVYYVAIDRISRIYLVDAMIEILFVVGWTQVLVRPTFFQRAE